MKNNIRNKNVKYLVYSAMFVTLATVTKFFTISLSSSFQISIGELPILLSGFLMGPIWGGITGLCNDLVTTITKGYPPSLFTVGKIIVGLLPGIALITIGKEKLYKNIPILFIVIFITLALRTLINAYALVIMGSLWKVQLGLLAPKMIINLIESLLFAWIIKILAPKITKYFS